MPQHSLETEMSWTDEFIEPRECEAKEIGRNFVACLPVPTISKNHWFFRISLVTFESLKYKFFTVLQRFFLFDSHMTILLKRVLIKTIIHDKKNESKFSKEKAS